MASQYPVPPGGYAQPAAYSPAQQLTTAATSVLAAASTVLAPGGQQPPTQHPPPTAAPLPVFVTSSVPVQGQPAEQPVSSDDRWAVLWTVLRLYYLLDASVAFVVALVGFIFSLASGGAGSACTRPFFVAAVLIFATRCVDFAYGLTSLCWCCFLGCLPKSCFGAYESWSKPETNKRPEETALGKSIRFNIKICVVQLILSVVQLAVGIAGLLDAFGDCDKDSPTLACVFGGLLLLNASEELWVWGTALLLHNRQDQIPLPNWVDSCIPTFVWDYSRRSARSQK